MKKHVHILMLVLLLVGQTILGPIGASKAFADSIPDTPVEKTVDEKTDKKDGDENKENKPPTEKPAEPSKPEDKPKDPETSDSENKPGTENKPSASEKPESGKGDQQGGSDKNEDDEKPGDAENGDKDSSKPEKGEKPEGEGTLNGTLDADGEKAGDDAVEPEDEPEADEDEAVEEEEEEEEEEDEHELVDEALAPHSLEDDATVAFDYLKVNNGAEIRNETDAKNVTPKVGDNVSVHYNIAIKAKQDSGVGSTFTFELPPALLNFDPTSLSGTLTEGDVKFSYSTIGKTVTVELIEGELFEENTFNGTLKFLSNFSADGAGNSLEQELEIPIKGSQSITIPFVFKPNTNLESMKKDGVPVIVDGERYINWTVWVNRQGEKLVNASLNDIPDNSLPGKHELDGKIAVTQYPVGLNGVSDNGAALAEQDNFSVALADGYYAYKLTYRTKVTEHANSNETFKNTATLTNDGKVAGTVSSSASHTYGTKLEKKVDNSSNGYGKYRAKWTVKYNYFGGKYTSQTLTDTLEGGHKVDFATFKVYEVAIDDAGNGTRGNEVGITPVPAAEDKGFTIALPSPNGEAYLIEYETEYDGEFIETGGRIDNKIVDENGEEGKDGFNFSEGLLSKTRSSIDYDKKEITWTISVTAENAMKNLVVKDTLTDYGSNGGTRQTIKGNGLGAFTINPASPNPTLGAFDDREGFTLNFGNVAQGQTITITYKTTFDILPNGTAYGEYKNTAKATWDDSSDVEHSLSKSANYSPGTSNTGNNGYKNGSFDHVAQVFNWNLAVNINKQEINGAVLTDEIAAGHELVEGTVKVHKLNLGNNDTGTKGSEVTSGFELSPYEKQKFTITFTSSTTDAYIVTYQTKDSDNIIGNGNSSTYSNSAVFDTPNSGKFTLPASVNVKHANKILSKAATQQPLEETITWKVRVNESHSKLGHIVLTDKMSPNQMILPGTFTKKEIKMDASGNHSLGAAESVTPTINNSDNSFTLDLGNLNQKGYEIEYKTFFLGADKEDFSNTASINYEGADIEAGKKGDGVNDKFNYNDSSGTITSDKGDLKIYKTSYNKVTGVTESLEGIKFELRNKSGSIKLYEGTTDANGHLTFENIRYGKYLLKELNPPANHDGLPANGKEITMSADIDFKVDGKVYPVVNNEKTENVQVCDDFILTIKDINGKTLTTGTDVKLTSKTDPANEKTFKVGADGKVTIDRAVASNNHLPAGAYKVTYTDGGTEYVLKDSQVISFAQDGGCKAEIQPELTCTTFVVTIEGSGKNLPNTIVVKNEAGDTVNGGWTIVDGKGKFTFNQMPAAGKYTVYENKQYVTEFTVDYKDAETVKDCGVTVTQAPTCETFALTVKGMNGELEKLDGKTVIATNKDDSTQTSTGTVKADGKVEFKDLEPGVYEVTVDGESYGEFSSNTNCAAEVQLKPTCETFTITVKENDQARPNVDVTVKDANGDVVHGGKTDAAGKISVTTYNKDTKELLLPKGDYKVYDGDLLIGTITVDYSKDCEAELNAAPKCEEFTLTVNDRSNNPRPDVEITLKDAKGNEAATGKTDTDGKVKFDNSTIGKGTYSVYEGTTFINNIEVTDKCQDTVKPRPIIPPAPTCTEFTITVYEGEKGHHAGLGIEVVLKSGDVEIAKGTTNLQGDV